MCGVGVSTGDETCYSAAFPQLNKDGLHVMHNAKFDLLFYPFLPKHYACTLIAAHLMQERRVNLKALALGWLQKKIVSFDELGVESLAQLPQEDVARYCMPHARSTAQLWKLLEPALEKEGVARLFWDVEMPLIPVMQMMGMAGIQVDKQVLVSLEKRFAGQMVNLLSAIRQQAGMPALNPNSTKQVAELLYVKLGLPVAMKTPGGAPSTKAQALEEFIGESSVANLVSVYRTLRKLRSDYAVGLQRVICSDGRVYTEFNQAGTGTGRLSSSEPNLQNIPKRSNEGKKLRRAFVAQEGYKLVVPDYDTLELRMITHFSQDPLMLRILRDPKGNPHMETALRVFRNALKRFEGKMLNYTVVYGAGWKQVASQGKMSGLDAKRFLTQYFEIYKGLRDYCIHATSQAREEEYVRTLHGRKRDMGVFMRGTGTAELRRHSVSTIIQGSSAEIVKKGMTRLFWRIVREGLEAKICLQVHDELVLEVPDREVEFVAQIAQEELPERGLSVPFPVTVKSGDNWGELHQLEEGK